MTRLAITVSAFMLLSTWLGCPAEALCTKAAKANIRSGPGTGYTLVWEVYKYMPFEKVGRSLSGNWFAVKDVDGDVSWIHGKLITGSYRCAVVKTSGTNVRTGPSRRFRKTSWSPAKQYDTFRVLTRKGSWARVKDEWGNTGWIHRDLLWIR